MECIDFRRRALTDPADPGSEALEHAHACAGCARFLYSLRQLETRCQRALAVDAPAGLTDRILLRHSVQQSKIRAPVLPGRSFAAASAAIAAAVLAVWLPVERGNVEGGPTTPYAAREMLIPLAAGEGRAPDMTWIATVPSHGEAAGSSGMPVFVGACSMPATGTPGAPLPWSRSLPGPGVGPLWSCPDCM